MTYCDSSYENIEPILGKTLLGYMWRGMMYSLGVLMIGNLVGVFLSLHLVILFPSDVNDKIMRTVPAVNRPIQALAIQANRCEECRSQIIHRGVLIENAMAFNVIYCGVIGVVYLLTWLCLSVIVYYQKRKLPPPAKLLQSARQYQTTILKSILVIFGAVIVFMWVHWYGVNTYPYGKISSHSMAESNAQLYRYGAMFWVTIFFVMLAISAITFAMIKNYWMTKKEI